MAKLKEGSLIMKTTGDELIATEDYVDEAIEEIGEGIDGSTIWTTTVAPTAPNDTFIINNLSGVTGATLKSGDIILYSYYRYTVDTVNTTAGTVFAPRASRVSIRGAAGAAGAAGKGWTGGSYNVSDGKVTFTSTDDLGFTTGDLRGAKGDDGQGVPSGGTAGQVLTKNTSNSYDTKWVDPSGGGVAASEVMMVVNHGSTAGTARPTAGAVYWIGTVEPTNAEDGDLWIGG